MSKRQSTCFRRNNHWCSCSDMARTDTTQGQSSRGLQVSGHSSTPITLSQRGNKVRPNASQTSLSSFDVPNTPPRLVPNALAQKRSEELLARMDPPNPAGSSMSTDCCEDGAREVGSSQTASSSDEFASASQMDEVHAEMQLPASSTSPPLLPFPQAMDYLQSCASYQCLKVQRISHLLAAHGQ